MRIAKTEKKKQQYFLKYPNREYFSDWEERCVKKFTYWAIIKNDFPYDLIAYTHHLLIPKRKFADFEDMNKKEFKELMDIRSEIRLKYDCILENLPRNRSVHAHFHFHLLVLKAGYK